MFSISLINYVSSNLHMWFNILIITIIIKIIIKLFGLLISKFRIAMISGALEDDIEDVEIIFKNISKYDIDVNVNTIGKRFVQGDKSRNIEGHGLGLSIIKSLVNI